MISIKYENMGLCIIVGIIMLHDFKIKVKKEMTVNIGNGKFIT